MSLNYIRIDKNKTMLQLQGSYITQKYRLVIYVIKLMMTLKLVVTSIHLRESFQLTYLFLLGIHI